MQTGKVLKMCVGSREFLKCSGSCSRDSKEASIVGWRLHASRQACSSGCDSIWRTFKISRHFTTAILIVQSDMLSPGQQHCYCHRTLCWSQRARQPIQPSQCARTNWLHAVHSHSIIIVQCFDTVGWATGRASDM